MASLAPPKFAREAALLGLNLSHRAFSDYYASLKGFRVNCPNCPTILRADRLNLHMVKVHLIASPEYHANLHARLRKTIDNLRKEVAGRNRLARLAAKQRKREFIRSGKLYPSAWRMVMEHKGTYVREVPGGAMEMNRRRH